MKVTYDRNARTRRDYDADVDEGRIYRAFGVRDHKGREIGGSVNRFRATFYQAPEEATYWHFTPVGHYYGFRCHATRDRRSYGSTQPEQLFTTAAERDAAVETYFRNAAKRAAKR